MKHIRHLTVEQHKELLAYTELLKHYQRLVTALQGQVMSYIEQEAGVDLGKEAWELDIDKGILTHDSSE